MKIIVTCLALLSSISLKAYEPKDLEHYLETKECMKCDLRGVSLVGQDLKGSNLRDADLSGSHLAQCVLDGSDLSGTKAENANFSGASLRGVTFNKSILSQSNFAGANVSESYFNHTNLVGANFSIKSAKKAFFLGTDLSYARVDAAQTGISLDVLKRRSVLYDTEIDGEYQSNEAGTALHMIQPAE